jgi:hypothetical protein
MTVGEAAAATGVSRNSLLQWRAAKAVMGERLAERVAEDIRKACRVTIHKATQISQMPQEQAIQELEKLEAFQRGTDRDPDAPPPNKPLPLQRLGKTFLKVDDRQRRRDFIEHVIWNNLDEEDRAWLVLLTGPWSTEYERKNRL